MTQCIDFFFLSYVVADTRCYCGCDSWYSNRASKHGIRQDRKPGPSIRLIVRTNANKYLHTKPSNFFSVSSTSFVGVTLYCFFGTSKDISIGPICKNTFTTTIPQKKSIQILKFYYIATVSLLVSTVVNSVIKINPTITPSEVAVTLGLFAGIISIIISLLRLGMLVDFIPGMI